MSKKSIETIVFQTHTSYWARVDLLFWILFLIIGIILAFFVIPLLSIEGFPSEILLSLDVNIKLGLAGLGALLALVLFFRFWLVRFQKIMITETHLIKENGWIMKNRIELPLPFLANATVRTSDSLWGALMGYANIKLDNMGAHADMEFVNVAKAKKFKIELKEAMFKHRPTKITEVPPTK